MAGRPLAPNGEGMNLKGLQDLVQKVKNKEFLSKLDPFRNPSEESLGMSVYCPTYIDNNTD
jgi:hypothetical protein